MCPQGPPHQLGPILSWHFPKMAKNNSNLDLFTGASDDKKIEKSIKGPQFECREKTIFVTCLCQVSF